jgi:hypothetical protein
LFNMFQAPLCPSSGAREYYTVGCCLWYLVLWFSSCRYGDTQPSAPHHTDNLKTKAPNTTGSNHLYNTLELLMMGIMVTETCWVSNKICNKKHLLHLVGILFPHINDDAQSKSLQIVLEINVIIQTTLESSNFIRNYNQDHIKIIVISFIFIMFRKNISISCFYS